MSHWCPWELWWEQVWSLAGGVPIREASSVVVQHPLSSDQRRRRPQASVLRGSRFTCPLCVSDATPVTLEDERRKESSSKVLNLAESLWAGTAPGFLAASLPRLAWSLMRSKHAACFCYVNEWMNTALMVLLFRMSSERNTSITVWPEDSYFSYLSFFMAEENEF